MIVTMIDIWIVTTNHVDDNKTDSNDNKDTDSDNENENTDSDNQ